MFESASLNARFEMRKLEPLLLTGILVNERSGHKNGTLKFCHQIVYVECVEVVRE
jgi:hypothetical protein